MIKKEINVINILSSSFALHRFGGKVNLFIKENIPEVKEPTLVLINLRGLDPLDYEFIDLAFSDIFLSSLTNDNIFLAFISNKWEKEELLTGIIHIMKIKGTAGQSDDELLIKNGINLIIVDEDDKVTYLSALDEMHLNVLKVIETVETIASSEIQEKFSLNAEQTTDILGNLLKSKFIYKTYASSSPLYSSVKRNII
jgi:hypothetical protein